MAAQFGTTMYTDVYLIATSIPVVIFSSFGGALGVGLIPLYIRILREEGKEEALKFINGVFSIVGLLILILICLGFFYTETLVNIFAMGFEEQALEMAIKFTRVLLPAIFFIGFNCIFTGYMQANKRFRIPGMISVPYNGVVIVSIFLASIWNQEILIYGTLLGLASQMVFQMCFAYRSGYSYRLYFSIHNPNIRKLFFLSIPIFLGMAVGEINVLIDKTLASTLYAGSISALNFANKLSGFVLETFIASVLVVAYPLFSELAARSDKEMLKKTVYKVTNGLILIMIPVSTLILCLHQPIVRVLFQRGVFDGRAVQMTSSALFFYSIGLMGLGGRQLLYRVFYALGDTKTPMINGIITVALNIVLNLSLLPSMRYKGIALATSVASWVGLILLFYNLREKIDYPFGNQHCKMMLKGLFAALIMGIGIRMVYAFMYPFTTEGNPLEGIWLAVVGIVGSGIYLAVIYILKVEEIHMFLNIAKNKIRSYYVFIWECMIKTKK